MSIKTRPGVLFELCMKKKMSFYPDLSSHRPPCSRPGAGFGGCVDLIVDGVTLLNKMGLTPAAQPHHHDYIENQAQLAQSFAYFFAPGAAAE